MLLRHLNTSRFATDLSSLGMLLEDEGDYASGGACQSYVERSS